MASNYPLGHRATIGNWSRQIGVATDLLTLPLRTADDTAEVHAVKLWILVGKHIRLYIAECRLRLVLDAVVEGLDDVLFKVLGARIGGDDRFAIGVGKFRVGNSENVHLD